MFVKIHKKVLLEEWAVSIGSQVAKRRRELRLTQQNLAEKMGVSFQAISSWEREEFLPDINKLQKLAAILNTKISYLLEENDTVREWDLHDMMFSPKNMLRRVRMYSQAKNMCETQKAIRLMLKYHAGAARKSNRGENVPYITHPLMMACHAFALRIDSDNLIAAILLHDVIEDNESVSLKDLNVNEEIKKIIDLVSFWVEEGMNEEEAKRIYYEKIGKNKSASILKLLDRCNNVSTMAMGFTPEKMMEYIEETEKYVLPLVNCVKYEYEYYNAAFLIKYQLLSVIETLKRTL